MESLYFRVVLLIFIFTIPRSYQASVNIVDDVLQSLLPKSSVKNLTLNTNQMITERGYIPEEYNVTTEDGYILTLNRIKNSGPVVFMMHGLTLSSDDWLTLGEDSLPFILSAEGYDVYLGNARGCKNSRKHISLSTDERAFWNFSFHEIGYYDVPAMIDYALETSNKSELTYVGHSQGTTVFFVMASLKPEYNKKVPLMISMGTAAWSYHVKTPVLRALVPLRFQESYIAETFGIYEVLSYNDITKLFTARLCPTNMFTQIICASAVFLVTGFDYPQLNYTQYSVELGHYPGGSSVKQLLHYGQLIGSRRFCRYDHELKEANMKAYGSETPPAYPVEKVITPIAIMYADNDWVSTYEDTQILIGKLPNVVDIYRVPYSSFNHLDYIWSKDAKALVYNKAIKLINKYNKK